MNTRYKWDSQQERYVTSDKLLLAMGRHYTRKVTRPMVVFAIGATPLPIFRLAYKHSATIKRVVWWAQAS